MQFYEALSFHPFRCSCSLLFYTGLFALYSSPIGTAQTCSYYTNRSGIVTVVDCSSRYLLDVPSEIPVTVETLLLYNNSIRLLPDLVFKNLKNLKKLDLSDNKIGLLQENCFSGLFNLTTLHLNGNFLSYTEDKYPDKVFQDLIGLEYLDIHRNNYNPNLKYPDIALSKLTSIKELAIDGLNTDLGSGFGHLNQLQVLNISGYGDDDSCQMGKVADTKFQYLVNISLRNLDMGDCGIKQVSQSAFKYLTHLESLTLSGNAQLGFDGVANASASLQYTNISELNLELVYHADPIRVSGKIFSKLKLTNLTSLKLGSNRIDQIDEDFAINLPVSLRYLSLHDNYLSDARFLFNLYVLKNLEKIDISCQLQYRSESKNPAESQSKITSSELQSHTNSRIPSSGELQYHPKSINLSSGELQYRQKSKNTSSGEFNLFRHKYYILLPPKVEYVIANNLKLGFKFTPNLNFSNNRMKYLDLSCNSLKLWIGKLYGLHHLEFFNLSDVNIFQIGTSAFGDMHSLRTLLLCCNHFGRTIMQDKTYLTFSNQTNLETLDLSNDEIKDLPEYIFANQKLLRNLTLRGNALTQINFHLHSLTNLENLDLSNNQLNKLSHQNMEEIDHILIRKSNKTLSINLKENLLKCTCDEQEFLNWMKLKISQTSVMFIDFENYTCESDKGELTSMQQLDDIVSYLLIHCVALSVVYYCVAIFLGLFLILSILAVIYYNRWKIKYLNYIKRKQMLPYRPLPGEEEEEIFDAYLSHSDTSNTLVQWLESQLTQRGRRIFIPSVELGGRLEINWTAIAIQKSNCVVALLTSDYVNDPMKVFEFNIAAIDGLHCEHLKLIPVLLQHNIPLKDYEREMLQFLTANPPYIYQNDDELLDYIYLKISELANK